MPFHTAGRQKSSVAHVYTELSKTPSRLSRVLLTENSVTNAYNNSCEGPILRQPHRYY